MFIEERLDRIQSRLERLENNNWDDRFDQIDLLTEELLQQKENQKKQLDLMSDQMEILLGQSQKTRMEKVESDISGLHTQTIDLRNRMEELSDFLDEWTKETDRSSDLDQLKNEFHEKMGLLEQSMQSQSVAQEHFAQLERHIRSIADFSKSMEQRLSAIEANAGSGNNDELSHTVQENRDALGQLMQMRGQFDRRFAEIDESCRTSAGRLQRLEEQQKNKTDDSQVADLVLNLEQDYERFKETTKNSIKTLTTRPIEDDERTPTAMGYYVGLAACLALIVSGWHYITDSQYKLPEIVKAKGFVLTDSDKTELASFQLNDQSRPSLTFNDENDHAKLQIGLDDKNAFVAFKHQDAETMRLQSDHNHLPSIQLFDGVTSSRNVAISGGSNPGFELYHPNGERAIQMEMNAKNQPVLTINNPMGSRRIQFGAGDVSKHGYGLELYDESDRLRAALGMAKLNEGATLNFHDEAEKPRIVMGSGINGATFSMLDAVGRQRTTLGITQAGYSILNLHDEQGTQRVSISASEKESQMQIMNPKGDLELQLPPQKLSLDH